MKHATRREFIGYISKGLPRGPAATLAGIRQDIEELLVRDPKLRAEVEHAEKRIEAEMVEHVMRAIDRGDTEAADWWRSRSNLLGAQARLSGHIPDERWETTRRRAEALRGR